MKKTPSKKDTISQRFWSAADEALEIGSETIERRRKAAYEATARASIWSGFAGDPEYTATLAARAGALAEDIAELNAPEPLEALASLRTLVAEPDAEVTRVVGHIDAPSDFCGSASLLDTHGQIIASGRVNRLGFFVILAEGTNEEASLEIRNDNDRLAVLDGAPLRLEPGVVIERDFVLARGGKVEPVEDPEDIFSAMPKLDGVPVGEAREHLAKLGEFEISITGKHDAARVDTVIAQAPEPEQPVRNGDPIHLTVSLGAERLDAMPELLGMTEREVRRVLSELYFKSVVFDERRDPENDGRVLAQKPAKDTPLGAKTKITLTMGVDARRMPDVTGKTEVDARRILVPDYVDSLDVVHESDKGPSKLVLRHQPEVGDTIGRSVTLVISVPAKESVKPGLKRIMPDLRGVSRAIAARSLKALGVKSRAFDKEEAPKKGYRVVTQDPPAGTALEEGQDVKLKFGPKK